jgi:plastocyanin
MRGTATIRRRVVVTIAALIAVALVAAGCGHDAFGMGDHHDQMHGGGDGAPQTPVLSDSSQVSVDIADFDFSPRELTVRAGATITWANRDSVPHDATDEAGTWGTDTLWPGESATITFDSPGAFEYLCTLHPNMKGTLTVEAAL